MLDLQNQKHAANLPISEIKIGSRFRRDLGDLGGLAQSISEDGLFQSIGVTPDYWLVFGYRRLIACRDNLRWAEIPVTIIDIENPTHGEWIENTVRKNLTLSEMVAITDALRSFTRGGDRRSDQYRENGNGVTKKEACELAGWKMDKYDDAKKVVEEGIPALVELMDKQRISPHAAAELANEPPEIQQEAVKKIEASTSAADRRGLLKSIHRLKNRSKSVECRQAEIVVPSGSDLIHLYHCPFQQLKEVAGLESASAQCVLTDIPHEGDFIDQLGDLAQFVAEILVPGGVFVCYLDQHRFNKKLRLIDDHLTYRWLGTTQRHPKMSKPREYNLVSKSTPIVIYSKGDWEPLSEWCDTLEVPGWDQDYHPYQRPTKEIERLVQYFTRPGDLVVDPCGGGFTTAAVCQQLGRRCVSCDIDKAYVVRGQERMKNSTGRRGDGTFSVDVAT